jgi:hypothetical protein
MAYSLPLSWIRPSDRAATPRRKHEPVEKVSRGDDRFAAVAAGIDQVRRGVEHVSQQRDLFLDRSHFAYHHRSAKRAGANLRRRAELPLVVARIPNRYLTWLDHSTSRIAA